MNTRTASLMAAVLAVAPLAAHASDNSVAQLAEETGLTERNVRMVLGARTPYPEYRVEFNRVQRQFKEAIGERNYDRLMRGESIVLVRKPVAPESVAKEDAPRARATSAPDATEG